MDCQFCTPTAAGEHQPGCPAVLLGQPGVQTDIRECTCGQMPHRADCMVVTGTRPAIPVAGDGMPVDPALPLHPCGCMTMLKGEVNAWLVAATGVEGTSKASFIAQASYLTSLLAQCEQRHHLQQVLPHD